MDPIRYGKTKQPAFVFSKTNSFRDNSPNLKLLLGLEASAPVKPLILLMTWSFFFEQNEWIMEEHEENDFEWALL